MVILIRLGRILCIAVGTIDARDQYFQIGDNNDAIGTIRVQRHRRQAWFDFMGLHRQREKQTEQKNERHIAFPPGTNQDV